DPDADSAVAMAFMNADRDTAKFDIADFARDELPLTGASGVGMWALAGAVLQAMAALIARVVREGAVGDRHPPFFTPEKINGTVQGCGASMYVTSSPMQEVLTCNGPYPNCVPRPG